MSLSYGVVVPSFGDEIWRSRAEGAVQSAMRAGADIIVQPHGTSLADARNLGAEMLETEFVTFLDADDRLAEGFFDNLDNFIDPMQAFLYQPQTLGMYPDGSYDPEPNFIERKTSLFRSNSLVIGTTMRLSDFRKSGGFDDSLPVLEDWDLFLRVYIAGASIRQCEGVVYIVGVNDDGRNSQLELHRKTYKLIQARYTNLRRRR